MKCPNIHRGMSLLAAERAFEYFGATVKERNRTGEDILRHPMMDKPIVVNRRRNDATPEMVVALKKLERDGHRPGRKA